MTRWWLLTKGAKKWGIVVRKAPRNSTLSRTPDRPHPPFQTIGEPVPKLGLTWATGRNTQKHRRDHLEATNTMFTHFLSLLTFVHC